MSIMQNVVLLVLQSNNPIDISWKGGNMILNRFCIDEEMANESSGVFYFNDNKILDYIVMRLNYSSYHRILEKDVEGTGFQSVGS